MWLGNHTTYKDIFYRCRLTLDVWWDCYSLQPCIHTGPITNCMWTNGWRDGASVWLGNHIPHKDISFYVDWLHMSGEMTLFWKLVLTPFTWIFLSHVDWFLMWCEIAFPCSLVLVITFITWKYSTLVNRLQIFDKMTLCSSMVVAFFTWIFHTQVDWFLMCSETSLNCSLVIAHITRKCIINVNWLWVCNHMYKKAVKVTLETGLPNSKCLLLDHSRQS